MAAEADVSVNEENRRPITQREHGYAKWATRVLANAGVTPNQISFSSMVFAALAGLCFYASALSSIGIDRTLLLLGAALFCQLRLLANMLDGMVAVEAKKGGPDGPIWNELPDRFSDIFVLIGAGYAVAHHGLADASLGWAAGVAAIMTAYARELARSAGAPADFSGPMAKPHRMFVMTVAALLSTVDSVIGGAWIEWAFTGYGRAGHGAFLCLALWIVLIGSTLTTLNRTRRAVIFLHKRGAGS